MIPSFDPLHKSDRILSSDGRDWDISKSMHCLSIVLQHFMSISLAQVKACLCLLPPDSLDGFLWMQVALIAAISKFFTLHHVMSSAVGYIGSSRLYSASCQEMGRAVKHALELLHDKLVPFACLLICLELWHALCKIKAGSDSILAQ